MSTQETRHTLLVELYVFLESWRKKVRRALPNYEMHQMKDNAATIVMNQFIKLEEFEQETDEDGRVLRTPHAAAQAREDPREVPAREDNPGGCCTT